MTSEVERIRGVYARRTGAERYAVELADVQAIDAHRRRAWSRAIVDNDIRCVVEVGAGSGFALGWMAAVGVTTRIATDLIHERLVTAAEVAPGSHRVEADGRALPLRDASVDAVAFSTLFSSVLDDQVAGEVAAEARRVLRPDGVVLWFDMRRANPSNRDVRPVALRDLQRLFPGWQFHVETVVLAPPIARRLRRWPRLISLAECVPFLRTHLVGVLRR